MLEQSLFSLSPETEAQLRNCTNLPSPPNVVVKIIQLLKDPNLKTEEVVNALELDPALTLKIMCRANSSFYGFHKKIDTLEKAIMVIGFNGILSLGPSFSLAPSLRNAQGAGLNYPCYWRRALITGSLGRALGKWCQRTDVDGLFMAAFLQDIGMLALDHVDPTLYANLGLNQVPHCTVLAHEREQLGTTHAVVGSWLLTQWNFPQELALAIRWSDEPDQIPATHVQAQFFQCVSFAASIAALYSIPASDEEFVTLSEQLQRQLGLGTIAFMGILREVKDLVYQKAGLFDSINRCWDSHAQDGPGFEGNHGSGYGRNRRSGISESR